MLNLINEIILNGQLTIDNKIEQLEKLLTITNLFSLSNQELIKLYERIHIYFKHGIAYFCPNKEQVEKANSIFKTCFCDDVILNKLLTSQNLKSEEDFNKFFLSIGFNDGQHCSSLYLTETTFMFHLLNFSLNHLPEYEQHCYQFIHYLEEQEQIAWLQSNVALIIKCVSTGHQEVIINLLKSLSSNVLSKCYHPIFKQLLQSIDNQQFFQILQNNESLTNYESITKNIDKRKEKGNSSELQEFLPFFFFKQSYQNLFTIYQILINSTLVPLLSVKEQEFVKLFIQLIENNNHSQLQIMEKLKKIEESEHYEEILYDICSHLRLLSAQNLVSNTFSIKQYQGQKEIVILPNELKYFFIRTNDIAIPFISKGSPVEAASFSIVSTDNTATYLGNERTIFGYSHIDPNMIAHVYPYDSSSCSTPTFPYYYTSCIPHFIDIQTLMAKANEKNTYPEIIIVKKHFEEELLYPDYILGINEFKKQDIEFAEALDIPKVKILVKDKSTINYKDYYNK